jgi:hypothetical protein
MAKQIKTVADLLPDPSNANKGTERGRYMVEASLRETGAGRSIVVDKEGRIIAGNKTLEAWADISGEIEIVRTDGKKLVVVQREDLDLADVEGLARKLAYFDNRASEVGLDWDMEQLLADIQAGVDLDSMFRQDELDELLAGFAKQLETIDGEKDTITRTGRQYNAGEGHEIEPFKLAHRIEAAWQSNGHKALDLFSGEGQLAAWYKRRFDAVVTVDKAYVQGHVDYSMPAMQFIKEHIVDHMDFDFVDFDDEGCPGREIVAFFDAIQGKKTTDFVLALTDGNGLNLQCRGWVDLSEMYLVEGELKRRATSDDYQRFQQYVSDFIPKAAIATGYKATQLSHHYGRQGHVIFQTWLICPLSREAIQ